MQMCHTYHQRDCFLMDQFDFELPKPVLILAPTFKLSIKLHNFYPENNFGSNFQVLHKNAPTLLDGHFSFWSIWSPNRRIWGDLLSEIAVN